MNIDDLREWLDYHYWARDRVLAAAESLTPEQFTRDLGNSFKSVRDTLVHIYGAEVVWCARWQGHSPAALMPADAFVDVDALRRPWRDLEASMRGVLERFAAIGPETAVEYRDLKGVAWKQPFRQMFQHVVNHASYHRGQVTTLIRQLGAPPPSSMDLIAFYRERGTR
ncbi:MAG: DinB family protein [Vicinamibacterales bacterium]